MRAPGPAKAIRLRCLHCTAGEEAEVRRCTATDGQCSLWPYRMGGKRDTSNGGKYPATRVRCIRSECVRCQGSPLDLCDSDWCPLWPYRMGRNPNRAGVGGTLPGRPAPESMITTGAG